MSTDSPAPAPELAPAPPPAPAPEVAPPPRPKARFVTTPLGYVWALPVTVFGMCFIPLALLSGGGVQTRRGTVEVYGGLVRWFLLKICGGAGAMTLGHTILGQNTAILDHARDHEHVHVEQYMRWGMFFLPAYGLSSFYCWRKGLNVYMDNRFEREAHARHYCP